MPAPGLTETGQSEPRDNDFRPPMGVAIQCLWSGGEGGPTYEVSKPSHGQCNVLKSSSVSSPPPTQGVTPACKSNTRPVDGWGKWGRFEAGELLRLSQWDTPLVVTLDTLGLSYEFSKHFTTLTRLRI